MISVEIYYTETDTIMLIYNYHWMNALPQNIPSTSQYLAVLLPLLLLLQGTSYVLPAFPKEAKILR